MKSELGKKLHYGSGNANAEAGRGKYSLQSPEGGVQVVGLAGPSGSGKSTVLRLMAGRLSLPDDALLSLDSYYRDQSHLPASRRGQLNFDHPGQLDEPLLLEHLGSLRDGRTVSVPVYDFQQHCRTDQTRSCGGSTILLVEGILLFHLRRVRELIDFRIYLEEAPDVCFIRRLLRDVRERGRTVESVVDQYLKSVRAMQLCLVEPSRRHAHLVVQASRNPEDTADRILRVLGNCLSLWDPF